jgi:hypothetical protein
MVSARFSMSGRADGGELSRAAADCASSFDARGGDVDGYMKKRNW